MIDLKNFRPRWPRSRRKKIERCLASAAMFAGPDAKRRTDNDHVDVWSALEKIERSNVAKVSDTDREIDEMLNRIDGTVHVTARRIESAWEDPYDATVDAFCASFADDAALPLRPASRDRAEKEKVEKRDRESISLEAAAKGTRPHLSAPVAPLSPVSPLSNVETVSETFERLERQSAGLDTRRRKKPVHTIPAPSPSTCLEGDMTLADSADRMVKNVETVCETFERLEQQFAGLERSCTEMLA